MNKFGMDKIPRCTLLDPVDHGKNYGYTSAKKFYEYVDIIHTSNMGSLNPYGHIDFYPNGGIQQPCTCSNPCKGVDCKKSQGTHSRAVVLYRVISFNHLLRYFTYGCLLSISKIHHSRNQSEEEKMTF